MSSVITPDHRSDYPASVIWPRYLRLFWWVASIGALTLGCAGIHMLGPNALRSSYVLATAYYLGACGLLFLLAWLLETTPGDAIKLPLRFSHACIAALALLVWMLRWHTGYLVGRHAGANYQISWYLFCAFQIIAVILALVFLHWAGRSPWWACLAFLMPLYDFISGSFSPVLVWTSVALNLLLAGLIFSLANKKSASALCLSLTAGIFPPALLLLPLLGVAGLPTAYPPPRSPRWRLWTAAMVPMAALWFGLTRWPVDGLDIWRWAAAIEPSAFIHAGLAWIIIYALILTLIWAWVLRLTLAAAPHPLAAVRAVILFFTLVAMANPLRALPGILLVLGLSSVIWTSSAWIMILLFLPLATLENQNPFTHDYAWRAIVNVPYLSIVLVLLLRDIVRWNPSQVQREPQGKPTI
jgi:hypothetical protein